MLFGVEPGLMDQEYGDNRDVQQGLWRSVPCTGFESLQSGRTCNASSLAGRLVRDNLCTYFNGDGAIPWQWNRTG